MSGIRDLMQDPATKKNAKDTAYSGAVAAFVGVGMIMAGKFFPTHDDEISKFFSYGVQSGGVALITIGGIIFVGCHTLVWLGSPHPQPQLANTKVPSQSSIPLPSKARKIQANKSLKTKRNKGWLPTLQGVNEYYKDLSDRFSVKKVHEHGQAIYSHLKETVSFREYFPVNKARQYCYSLYSKYFKTETPFQNSRKKKKKRTRKEDHAIDETQREQKDSFPHSAQKKKAQRIDSEKEAATESKTGDRLRGVEIRGESTKNSTLKIQKKLIREEYALPEEPIEDHLSQVISDSQKDQTEHKDEKMTHVIKAQQEQIASLLQENEKLKSLSKDDKYSEEKRKEAEALSKELEQKLKKASVDTQYQAIESNKRENFLQTVIYRQGILLHDLVRRVNNFSSEVVPVAVPVMVMNGAQLLPSTFVSLSSDFPHSNPLRTQS